MAYKNKTITNPKTGQKIKFLQTAKDTNGALLEMEATFNPFSTEPLSHYHPVQQEDFTILAGELTVKIEGQLKVLKAGDTLHVPENTTHAMWNSTDSKTVVNWKIQPALNTEHFLEMFSGLARDGKTNERGVPNIVHVAYLSRKFSQVFRLSKPSYLVQRVVFGLLKPFAVLAGYSSRYGKYVD